MNNSKKLTMLVVFFGFSLMLFGCSTGQISDQQAKQLIKDYQKIKYQMDDPKEFTTLDTQEATFAYIDKRNEKAASFLTEEEHLRFIIDRRAQYATTAADANYKVIVKDVTIEKIIVDEKNNNNFTIDYSFTLTFTPTSEKEVIEETHNGKIELIKNNGAVKIDNESEDISDSILLKLRPD
ncbi:hypothetical protein [Brevibacillus daliensis]|uniref:hypothetical protein n=1 Tax=Brevibacillus daliensis TaxID=2892995 RepID=UPI001E29F449|nr:hypothetical protein [Brevibacillus daliensis]